MKLPSPEQLAQLSVDFDYEFPSSYLQFVQSPGSEAIAAIEKRFPNGWFVTSRSELRAVPKFFRGELIPFFVQGDRDVIASVKSTDFELPRALGIVCFDLMAEPIGDEPRVTVFSIHTTVAEWPTFHDWLEWVESDLGWIAWDERRKRIDP